MTTNTVKHTPDAREWQDISTAPMNAPGESYGPWILVFHRYDFGVYQARYECHGDKRGWFAKGDPRSIFNHHITHWMPLPPAPQEKGSA